MKALFVADPHQTLNPVGDSTLAMVRAGLDGGDEVHWALADGIEYEGGAVMAETDRIVACGDNANPQAESGGRQPVENFDAVFIRKDPPVDVTYVKMCWLLALCEARTRMFNSPSLLLRYHEKLLPLEGVAQGFLKSEDLIPTFIGRPDKARAWIKGHGYDPVIVKPFLGFGGRDIERVGRDTYISRAPETVEGIVQPYRAEVETRGDRRVLFLDGKVLAHFVRMPKSGGFVSNLAQGGSAVKNELLPEEKDAVARLGKFLKTIGIVFAGADLIGRYVSEVNITSPTGLRQAQSLDGSDYAVPIMEFSRNAAARKR